MSLLFTATNPDVASLPYEISDQSKQGEDTLCLWEEWETKEALEEHHAKDYKRIYLLQGVAGQATRNYKDVRGDCSFFLSQRWGILTALINQCNG